jgi:hypothetical protein
MKDLHEVLDNHPERAGEMVELDIRNRQAWKELHHFELTGDFLWKHPVLQKKKAEKALRKLKEDDPAAFMNIYVQNKNKNKDEKESVHWQSHIERFTEENELIEKILNE